MATNPDVLDAKTLQQQTWPLAEAHFKQATKSSKNRYQTLVGSNHTTDRLTDILNAAHDGQVEALFVASDRQKWGTYDVRSRQFTESDRSKLQSSSLLNLAAIYTLNCRGQVFVMDLEEMPTNTMAAAILRYPMPQKMDLVS